MAEKEKDAFFDDDLYDDDEDTMENVYLTFAVSAREYGLEVKNVIEITGLKGITEVPDMPRYVKGIMNLRGKIIPLVDVRLRFNNPEAEYTERTCVVIVNLEDMLVGLIVDGVSEVLRIAEAQMEKSPSIGGNGSSRFIQGIGKVEEEVKLILNLENFLGESDIEALEGAKQCPLSDGEKKTDEDSIDATESKTTDSSTDTSVVKEDEELVKT
jgi:purine-binding chemotaxis protein CheW